MHPVRPVLQTLEACGAVPILQRQGGQVFQSLRLLQKSSKATSVRDTVRDHDSYDSF